jgi:sugar-specific transcriptional regulator TrmB
MSLERVIKALIDLGLPRQDAEIYVYLTKNGPLSETTLEKKLKLKRRQLNQTLKNLRHKEIVRIVDRNSAELCAVPFEAALNLLIEINKQQNDALQDIKRELLENWPKISRKTPDNT